MAYLRNDEYKIHHEIKELNLKCPICGKRAASRYWNADLKKYVYRHSKLVPMGPRKLKGTQTEYHYAES